MNIKRQRGLSLLETSIALALMALGVIATLQMRVAQSRVDSARAVGQVYERLNNAAGSYMTLFYDQILRKDMPECSVLPYRVGGNTAVPQLPPGDACAIFLESSGRQVRVENYLQPKPSELKALGLLAGGAEADDNALPLLTHLGANREQALFTYGADGNLARNGFAVLIQLVCVGDALLSEPVVNRNACGTRRFDLRSLVFNLQPYVADGPSAGLLSQLVDAAGGGRTYLSDDRYEGRLKDNSGGSVESGLSNPLRLAVDPARGAPHVVAIRNGYGSAGNDVFVRRDGSTPLTGDWNVGGKSVTGVNNLGADTGTFTTVTVKEGLTAKNVTAVENVSADKGIFGKFAQELTAALNATTAYIKDRLTVAGTLVVDGAATLKSTLTVSDLTSLNGGLNVSGAANLNGVTRVKDLVIDKAAALGGTCNPENETVAQVRGDSAEYKNETLRYLVCDRDNKVWVRAQRDFGADINILYDQVAKVSTAVATVEGSVSGIVQDAYFLASWGKTGYREEGAKYVLPSGVTLTPSDYDYTYIKVGTSSSNPEAMWKPTPWACPYDKLKDLVPNYADAAYSKRVYFGNFKAPTTNDTYAKDLTELNARLKEFDPTYYATQIFARQSDKPLPKVGPVVFAKIDVPSMYGIYQDFYSKTPPGSVGGGPVGVPRLAGAAADGYVWDVMCMPQRVGNELPKQNVGSGPAVWHVAYADKALSIKYGNNCQSGLSSRYRYDYFTPWGGGVKWDWYDDQSGPTRPYESPPAALDCLYGNLLTVNWTPSVISNVAFTVKMR